MTEELVYNLIPKGAPETVNKSPLYQSRYPPPPSYSTFGIHTTTQVVGNPGGRYPPSRSPVASLHYIRERKLYSKNYRSKSTKTPEISHDKSPLKHPRVPKVSEKPIMGLRSRINYVLENPKALKTKIIIEAKSDNPMQSQRFAKVPDYIRQIRRDISEEKRRIVEIQKEKEREKLKEKYLMKREEVSELRNGLKKKWESLHNEYQLMTHMTKPGTDILVRKKENYEKELDQIEKDLKLLSKQHIMVDNKT